MDGISGTDYFLAKMESKLDVFRQFNTLRKNASNWVSVAEFRAGMKESVVVKLRNGKTIKADRQNPEFWTDENWLTLKFSGLPNNIKVVDETIGVSAFGKNFKFEKEKTMRRVVNVLGVLEEQFVAEPYKELEVEGKTVLDIGANVGDTIVYFAAKGAKHIIALEPYPYLFHVAKHNVSLNGLDKMTTLLNNGCGKEGWLVLPESLSSNMGGSMVESKTGKKVKILTLESLVKDYKLKNAALKMDCEGHEYEIFKEASPEVLAAFDGMAIEYHHGYQEIEQKLVSCGFEVRHTRPKFTVDETTKELQCMGFVYARRKG